MNIQTIDTALESSGFIFFEKNVFGYHWGTTFSCDVPFVRSIDKLSITSGKLWLKMRRMGIISPVLHIFVSSPRLKHRMRLIQRALDSTGLVDYFSYPHHGQRVRKKFLEIFEGKNLPQR